ALPRWPIRRAARGDRAAAVGHAAGVRRRRLLSRLRARPLRDGSDPRRGRRPEEVPVLRRYLTPWRVAGGVVVLLGITLLIPCSIPSGKFLLLPDTAHPVSPLVQLQGAQPTKPGTLYFVDVVERRASELEALFPWIHPHGTLEPAGSIVPPCATDAQAEQA